MSLDSVHERMRAACARAGRDPADVTLVAVTKNHGADEVRRDLIDRGVLDLGENRVQEWRDKAAVLPEQVRWHFIGNLQRNKVKYLAEASIHLVHSLNSVRLADALETQGRRRDHRFRALVEVDVANEEAKQGVGAADLDALLEHGRGLSHVEIVGLMAMAPFSDDPEDARPHFRRLRELADAHGLPERSMGMSGDFEVAIEEGATLIRVGSALFEGGANR